MKMCIRDSDHDFALSARVTSPFFSITCGDGKNDGVVSPGDDVIPLRHGVLSAGDGIISLGARVASRAERPSHSLTGRFQWMAVGIQSRARRFHFVTTGGHDLTDAIHNATALVRALTAAIH